MIFKGLFFKMSLPNVINNINDLEIKHTNDIIKHTTDIEELQSTKVNISALLNLIYPVGSIYFSVNNVSPQTFIGGTWEQIQDKFLLCSGSSYSAGSTGGEVSHTHEYGIQFGGYYRDIAMESNTYAGVLQHGKSGVPVPATSIGSFNAPINNNSTTAIKTVSMGHYASVADTSITSNMPPYLAVYVWKRTS